MVPIRIGPSLDNRYSTVVINGYDEVTLAEETYIGSRAPMTKLRDLLTVAAAASEMVEEGRVAAWASYKFTGKLVLYMR